MLSKKFQWKIKMIVEQDIISRATEIYKPEFRFIRKAELNYPDCNVIFEVKPGLYTKKPLKFASCADIQFCLNQMAYVSWAQILREEKIDVKQTCEDFLRLCEDGMFVMEQNRKNRKPISLDNLIRGKLTLTDYRDMGKMIIGLADFDIENKSCFGSLKVAIINEKDNRKIMYT